MTAHIPENEVSGFTPGPWTADGPDMFGDFNILHPADSLAVAAVVKNMRLNYEVRGNARLIAAAPDMYEALVSFDRLMVAREAELGALSDEMAVVVQQARNALAKARGAA